MKSSVAIFSNQGNPFSPVKRRSQYRPSQPKMLSEKQKRTVLSPVRLPHHLSEELSPPDLNFLGGSQRFVSGLPESDSSGPFDESWPSSEDSSKTPEQDRMQTRIGGGSDPAFQTKEDSVIARYMARFRTGPPTNRQERSPPQPATKEFWWLQTSPHSPDVHRFRPGSGIATDLGFSLQSLELTPPLAEASMNDSKLCPEDVDIFRLQERARKLILQSESSLNSGDHVSSDGVGSSPSSVSDISGIRSSSYERAPVPIQRTPVIMPTPSVRTHATIPPEEDILYQWRLRRKMEQAREGTISLSTCKRSSSPPVRIPKVVLPSMESSETAFRGVPPVAAKSSHTAEYAQSPVCFSQVPLASPNLASYSLAGIVPPHLHLQCDVLPCIHSQHPAPCTKQKQESQAVKPMAVPADSPAPLAETSVQSPEKNKSVCKQPSERPRRKRDRTMEKNTKSKGDNSKEASPKGGHVTTLEDPPPSSSPVHQAMEQVISERLFSSLQSPKLKPKLRTSAPPKEEKEELQPQEIAASLLEQAEDSDGTEFRDDPLLEVLREQRESLRVRLREVDLHLAELEGENKENQSQPQ